MEVFVLVLEYDNGRYGTDSSVGGVYSSAELAHEAAAKEFFNAESHYVETYKVDA